MYQIKNSNELASLIDYTNLNNMISQEEMEEFLDKTKEFPFRAVVINPTYVPLAKEKLNDTDTKIATVVGFPLGFESTEAKLAEAKVALNEGADEIDMVINLNYIKNGQYDLIKDEAKRMKELLGDKTLKVIIETKALNDEEKIQASKALEEAGVDYIKSSTGFLTPNHIYENVNDINIIQKYAPKTKIKISGGIDNYKLANQLLTGGADIIGTSNGYEIVSRYKDLRENTQVKPKPIKFN